jgi:hypothetical protein
MNLFTAWRLESLLKKLAFISYLFFGLSAAFGAEKAPKQRLLFSATVRDIPIHIYMTERPFDPANHKITPAPVGSEAGSEAKLVDGRLVVGLDGAIPKAGISHLASLSVLFGERRVDVPEQFIAHIFGPHDDASFRDGFADTIVSVSADGKAVIISFGVGDGGGTTFHRGIFVGADGKCSDEELRRPEP